MKTKILFSVVGTLLLSATAHAFPEMVRHGYAACVTCHVSPDGGGVLTWYGREISGAALSTWGGREKSYWGPEQKEHHETFFAWDLITPPEWLLLGGDVRLNRIQYRTQDGGSASRLILMQADLEAAAKFKKLTIDATIGRDENAREIFSRRHFLKYQLNNRTTVRFGKFFHAYGIRMPEHAVSTKRGLGWDQGSESYNIEGALVDSNYDVFLTALLSRPETKGQNGMVFGEDESGFSARASTFLAEKYKIGASFFTGSTKSTDKTILGPFAMLGFTPHFTVLSEFDFTNLKLKSVTKDPGWGLVSFNKADYELIQGLHAFATYETYRPAFSDSTSGVNTLGAGLQWFPRPHFELQTVWKNDKPVGATEGSHYFFLMAHFYP
ncbi:MAG: hypothetical protein NDJ89_04790 [Oligoflexia bacterium]|nr:hypothetical protein [Oligoflexia bacterium]